MTIKIKVYAPGFINHDAIDQNGFIELLENEPVKSLYRKLKIPLYLWSILSCYINYERVKLSTVLKDGDEVTFIFPIAGG